MAKKWEQLVAVLCAAFVVAVLVPGAALAAGTYSETTGGMTHTWTNYTNAGGIEGPTIPSRTTVQIACKVTGFRVADGNTNWYRIASAPWNSAYYASADAFYNNGATSGSLRGTPFVDPAVIDCSALDATPPPPPPAGLRVSLTENPFTCNGGSRQFGQVAGAAAGERINFSSPGLSLLSGTANSNGTLNIRWQCNANEAGTVWTVTARGASSGRTATFTVTGRSAGTGPLLGGVGRGTPPSGGGSTGGGVQLPAAKTYNRQNAVAWATAHWNDSERFKGGDCTWFVSQALWAGGLKQTGDWTGASWDPRKLASKRWGVPAPTKAAAQTQPFVNYALNSQLVTKTKIEWSDNTAGHAQLGDIIAYDWNEPGPDGNMDHMAIVTGFSNGYPLVSQHTSARLDRGWSWDTGANNWIEFSQTHDGKKPVAWLLHVIG